MPPEDVFLFYRDPTIVTSDGPDGTPDPMAAYRVASDMYDLQGAAPLFKVARVKLDQPRDCAVAFMNVAATAPMKAVHDRTLEGLPPEYMYPKSEQYFLNVLSNANNAIVGIIDGDILAAKSILTCPDDESPYGWGDNFTPPMRDDEICVSGGISVLPEYRGNEFMRTMVHSWKEHAGTVGREWLLAEVDVRNLYSLENFLSEGLHVIGLATDKSDGGNNYIVARRTEDAVAAEPILDNAIWCDVMAVDEQRALLNDGYVGVSCDMRNQRVAYAPAV
jgi:hypothetical protein